ncbi:MAG TPA: GNAT family protein [Rectinemataceae bacterium]|nr:GNAT family protein [Rectinemataceae bacterium]
MLTETLRDAISIGLLEKRHAPAMLDFVERGRERFVDWIPFVGKTRDLADFEALIRRFLKMYAEGSGAFYALWDGALMVGMVLIKEIDEEVRQAEIGYMIDLEYEGRGLVKAACLKLIGFLFEDMCMQKIRICCDDRNARSIALAERLGFSLEGNLRRDSKINGNIRNTMHFGLLKEEWSPESP